MPIATQVVPSFLGGEISQFAQGRFDKPDYHVSLNICLNAFPVEIGAWTRRPGTQYAGHTRGGASGRVLRFDFEQSAAVTAEYTDGYVRFRSGTALITTNDAQTISAISTANPAVVQTAKAHGWTTGNTVIFPAPCTPLLENRQFTITVVDTTHFSLQDALTSVNIDGSTLGTLAANATVKRVHELQTPYLSGSWSTLRTVQAETTQILLSGSITPQALTVSSLPTATTNTVFSIASATFTDGPYLDPFTSGVQVSPNTVVGIVTMTMTFPAYSASKAYATGAFVTSSGVNYESLIDQNVGNTPVSSPSAWAATTVNAAINNGAGFSGSDIGRLVRFLSEPAYWASGTTYTQGTIVSYNPSGVAGATTYWQSLVGSNLGNVPGADTTHWQLVTTQGAALWTWGKITSLSNLIDRASGSNIGTLTSNGGLSAAFDGILSQTGANSAVDSYSGGLLAFATVQTLSDYVGKHYSGGAQQIQGVTIYPSNDNLLGTGGYHWVVNNVFYTASFTPIITLNLRAKQTAPASSSDGTLLGTSGAFTGNASEPINIVSTDQSTAWNYVWVEISAQIDNFSATNGFGYQTTSWFYSNVISQVSFFSPVGNGSGAFNVEILGPSLPTQNTIQTWRLGVYSNATGWPTCGCYHEGRLWLGGAVANRFDACVSNGISGSTVNFAPTDQYGVVAANAAISYTLNADGVNQMFWMKPDLQGVVIGTQNGEWLVQAPTTGPIAASNIAARRMTKHGSTSNIEPIRTPHANVFVKRYSRHLLEYFSDAFSGKYSAPNLADKAEHITANGIVELAYTSATTPIMWGRDTVNSLFGLTYKRNSLMTSQPPDFYAWHRHTLGSGRVVESICDGPSVGGSLDALTMVTNDTGVGVRHVEVLTDPQNELTALSSSWFLDDAINPTSMTVGASNVILNGLTYLNGKTVQVFVNGLDLGDNGDEGTTPTDFVVSNGSITIGYGDGISAGPGRGLFTQALAATLSLSQYVIGFTYNSDGQIVRPIASAETGARNGPAFGKLLRVHRYAMKLVNSLGLSVGTDFSKLTQANFRQADGVTAWVKNTTAFSGIHYETMNDTYSHSRSMCWRVSRPWPTTVVAIAVNQEAQDQ